MVSVSGLQVHVLRLTIVVALVLIIFLFFDPIGFASESLTNFMTPGSTHVVTHLVLFHFSKSADPAAVRQVCSRDHSISILGRLLMNDRLAPVCLR